MPYLGLLVDSQYLRTLRGKKRQVGPPLYSEENHMQRIVPKTQKTS